MTRSEWRDEMERTEARLEPFLRRDEGGQPFIPAHPALATLTTHHNRLTEYGLERGWLTAQKEDA